MQFIFSREFKFVISYLYYYCISVLCSTDDDPKTWEEIRDECLEGGFQWEDPDFPAEADTLFYNTPPSVWPNVQWQRPHVSLSSVRPNV